MASIRGWDTARLVTVDEVSADDCIIVGLAEEASGSGRQLILQASMAEPDEQDTGLGFDTYCLVNEDSDVHYGGVGEVRLSGDYLRIDVSPEAADDLGWGSTRLEVRVEFGTVDRAHFVGGLRRVFGFGNPAQYPILLVSGEE